jgi:hypothetical protein
MNPIWTASRYLCSVSCFWAAIHVWEYLAVTVAYTSSVVGTDARMCHAAHRDQPGAYLVVLSVYMSCPVRHDQAQSPLLADHFVAHMKDECFYLYPVHKSAAV